MEERNSFAFRKEWRDAISELPDEVRLEFYEAIIEYGISGRITDLRKMAGVAFRFAKADIDREADVKRRRSEAGSRHKGNQYSPISTPLEENRPIGTNWNKRNKLEQTEQIGTNGTSVSQEIPPLSPLEENSPIPSKEDNPLLSPIEEREHTIVCQRNAANAAELMKKHYDAFVETLAPYGTTYPPDMIADFLSYWTEPNKSRTKMRFELERTWDIGRRLQTWARRTKFDNNGTHQHNSQQSRLAGYANVAAEFLGPH